MPVQTTKCPICARPVAIPGDVDPLGSFPFCSERCKVIDLGRWLDGRYQIPAEEKDEDVSSLAPPADDDEP